MVNIQLKVKQELLLLLPNQAEVKFKTITACPLASEDGLCNLYVVLATNLLAMSSRANTETHLHGSFYSASTKYRSMQIQSSTTTRYLFNGGIFIVRSGLPQGFSSAIKI